MKRILLFFLLIAAGCCDPQLMESPSNLKKGQLINEVNLNTFSKLKNDKELYPIGCGAGAMDQINLLSLSFRYYKDVDINQSRELTVFAGTTLLDMINSNEEIRPFLQYYPFKPENIEIEIYLQKADGTDPDLGKLTAISMFKGVLNYMVKDSEPVYLKTVRKESFEDAAALLSFEPNIKRP